MSLICATPLYMYTQCIYIHCTSCTGTLTYTTRSRVHRTNILIENHRFAHDDDTQYKWRWSQLLLAQRKHISSSSHHDDDDDNNVKRESKKKEQILNEKKLNDDEFEFVKR